MFRYNVQKIRKNDSFFFFCFAAIHSLLGSRVEGRSRSQHVLTLKLFHSICDQCDVTLFLAIVIDSIFIRLDFYITGHESCELLPSNIRNKRTERVQSAIHNIMKWIRGEK